MQSLPPDSASSTAPSESTRSTTSKRGSARRRQAARKARQGNTQGGGPPALTNPLSGVNAGGWLRGVQGSVSRLPDLLPDRVGRRQVIMAVGVLVGLVLVFSLISLYAANRILPGVSVAGISLGRLSEQDAISRLQDAWAEQSLTLRDGDRTWQIPPPELGFTIDAVASARQAVRYGRDSGGLGALFSAALSGVDMDPVIDFNVDAARAALLNYAREVNVPAQNATVRLQGALVTHIDAQPGRRLNVNELLPALAVDPSGLLEGGVINLPMLPVAPLITDATPLVAYAQTLLQRPLRFEAYDPVEDQSYDFEIPPETWGQWLDTQLIRHETGPRLYLSVNATDIRDYLQRQALTLPQPLTLDLTEGVRAVQQSLADGTLSTWVSVRYLPVTYTVQRGETAYSISRSTGIPFYLIEQANPDIDLSEIYPGNEVMLPSRDIMLPLRPVRTKRIVVDLSEQHLWAYENGEIIFEWDVSTGISTAPTSSGVFQIISHDEVALGSSYTLCDEDTCGQWRMHWFMGIYEVVPGLVNGFHGAVELPDGRYLGGGQVGRPFTFGCIMSLDSNAIDLYNWAEEGVVVEIRQ